jgi:mRNA interferase RelE/StbE
VTHEVFLKPRASKELAALDAQYREDTAAAIAALGATPRPDGCKKLKGKLAGLYRIKVRAQVSVIYMIDDGKLTVLVVTIEKRGDAY